METKALRVLLVQQAE
jgi:hypothetical protein